MDRSEGGEENEWREGETKNGKEGEEKRVEGH